MLLEVAGDYNASTIGAIPTWADYNWVSVSSYNIYGECWRHSYLRKIPPGGDSGEASSIRSGRLRRRGSRETARQLSADDATSGGLRHLLRATLTDQDDSARALISRLGADPSAIVAST